VTRRRALPKRQPYIEEDIEWDSSREWPDRWVRWLLARVKEDYWDERFARDLPDKLRERSLSEQSLLETVASPLSYIARFRYAGSNRVGFWNPRTRLLVVWKPGSIRSASRYMTCFEVYQGLEYLRRQDGFREIRRGRVK